MGRLGWFPWESLNLFFEYGGRAVNDADALTLQRFGFGANWQLLPWVELMPELRFEHDTDNGTTPTLLAQFHIFY